MQHQVPSIASASIAHPAAPQPRVLIVDDSRAQRQLLGMYLRRWGYAVVEAATGEEALEICAAGGADMVLSDWMMPGMSGVDLCRRFRALNREGYGWFILLTSRSGKAEIAAGLEAGADDFLTKPFSGDELHARLRAGGRILAMQAELVERNRQIEGALGEQRRLYDLLERDLQEARRLQQGLLGEAQRDYGSAKVSLMLRASGHVGGDLVGSFRMEAGRIALWSVDVSGHGVASAMMTARLAGHLSEAAPDRNLAFQGLPDGSLARRRPAETLAAFNELMLGDLQLDQYCTFAWAELDLASGRLDLVQAGHPHPLLLRRNGKVERLGCGGLPVGLFPEAAWEEWRVDLAPGDRLVMLSDGFTECPGVDGAELGEEGLRTLLRCRAGLSGSALLDALLGDLAGFAGTDRFPDDVSGLVLDYAGTGSSSP